MPCISIPHFPVLEGGGLVWGLWKPIVISFRISYQEFWNSISIAKIFGYRVGWSRPQHPEHYDNDNEWWRPFSLPCLASYYLPLQPCSCYVYPFLWNFATPIFFFCKWVQVCHMKVNVWIISFLFLIMAIVRSWSCDLPVPKPSLYQWASFIESDMASHLIEANFGLITFFYSHVEG